MSDDQDRCPNTPAGTAVNASGCPRDSDSDGVLDPDDKCPNTPAGAPVDATGCPKDTDRDGVMDKWETYESNRVVSVAFDERHLGKPTRRILYSPDGATRIEVDPAGDGHFIEQPPAQPAARPSQ